MRPATMASLRRQGRIRATQRLVGYLRSRVVFPLCDPALVIIV